MPEYRLVIPSELEGFTVRRAAMGGLGMSGGQFKRAKFHGSVLLNGQPVLADARVHAGDALALVVPDKENTLPAPCAMPLSIPYEDDWFWMVDKPAPLPTACSCRQSGPTLENALYAYAGCPAQFVYRPVNRLDKGTSGLMLAAKNAHAQHLLQQLLHGPDFVREYLAVVEGAPPQSEGVIDLPIAKADEASVRRVVSADGKPARTRYRVEARAKGRTLVRLRLDTGRTHQIRVHMAHLGCPVAGDFLYGSELASLPGRFALHSALLRVRHPVTGEWVERESPLPQALRALMR
ncbi:MAG: RluA family pseudouridine synthase [Clostridiales bacterium]|nr:RluA family pseudouridine synthase [Clostridiales bacterium]